MNGTNSRTQLRVRTEYVQCSSFGNIVQSRTPWQFYSHSSMTRLSIELIHYRFFQQLTTALVAILDRLLLLCLVFNVWPSIFRTLVEMTSLLHTTLFSCSTCATTFLPTKDCIYFLYLLLKDVFVCSRWSSESRITNRLSGNLQNRACFDSWQRQTSTTSKIL